MRGEGGREGEEGMVFVCLYHFLHLLKEKKKLFVVEMYIVT